MKRALILIACTMMTISGQERKAPSKPALNDRMKQVVIPKLTVKDMEISQVFRRLTQLSKTHGKGAERIQFHVIGESKDMENGKLKGTPKVTLDFTNITLDAAVREICNRIGYDIQIGRDSVLILEPGAIRKELQLRFYHIDPDMIKAAWGKDAKAADIDFKTLFEGMGVEFTHNETGTQASVSYDRGTGQIIVLNTLENVKLIERILRRLSVTTPQVAFSADMIEVDVSNAQLAKIEPGELGDFISKLPEKQVRYLSSKNQLLTSQEEGYVGMKGDIAWNGGNGYGTGDLTLTPAVSRDYQTISLSCHWRCRVWGSKQDAMKAIAKEGTADENLTCDLDYDIRTEFTTSSGSSTYFKVTSAKPHLKRGAILLVLRSTIVEPDGTPSKN